MTDFRSLIWNVSLEDGRTYGGSVGLETHPGPFNLSNRMLSFTYEHEDKQKAILKMTIFNEDLAFFRSPSLMKGQTLDFSFGYYGFTGAVYSATITGVKGFTTLEVEATVGENDFDYTEKNAVWTGKTRSQIAEEIGLMNGFTCFEIEETTDLGSYQQVQQSDRTFLASLARSINFVLLTTLESGVLTLHFHKKITLARPLNTYVWRGGGGTSVTFDLLNGMKVNHVGLMKDFNITENSLLGKVQAVEVDGYDPVEKQPLKSPLIGSTAKTSLGTMTELVNPDTLKTKMTLTGLPKSKMIKNSAAQSLKDVGEEADAEGWKQQEGQIKATAVIVGDPRVEAGWLIDIGGLPEMLAGNYYVKRVTHKLDGNGYSTDLELERDAWGDMPLDQQDLLPGAGKPNKTKPLLNLEQVFLDSGNTRMVKVRP